MFLFLIFFYLFSVAQAQIINCELGAQDTALPREENNCKVGNLRCDCANGQFCPAGYQILCPSGQSCIQLTPTITPTPSISPTPTPTVNTPTRTPTWTNTSAIRTPTPTPTVTSTWTVTVTFTPQPTYPTITPGATPTPENCDGSTPIQQIQDLGLFSGANFILPVRIKRGHAVIMVQEPVDFGCTMPIPPIHDSRGNTGWGCPAGHCNGAVRNEFEPGDTISNPCGVSSNNPWHLYDYFGIGGIHVNGCGIATGALSGSGARVSCDCYPNCEAVGCNIPCDTTFGNAGCACTSGLNPPSGQDWSLGDNHNAIIVCGLGSINPFIIDAQRFTTYSGGTVSIPFTGSCGSDATIACVSDMKGCLNGCQGFPPVPTPTDTPSGPTPTPTCVQGICMKNTVTPTP